jgi:hypothetical protein
LSAAGNKMYFAIAGLSGIATPRNKSFLVLFFKKELLA